MPPTPSTVSLGELVELAGRGQLSLAAPEGLMRDSRVLSSRLVVPVLQGKPTPPIVVQAAPGSGGKVTVVGGSARLAALLAFVSGDSSVAGGAEWPAAPVELDSREDAFIRWNGKSFQQLPDAVKQQVAGYAVSVQQA